MDKLDVRIVTCLQKDGTSTNVSIARKVGVSEETVRRRRMNLMADGYIKIVAIPDAQRMGYQSQVIVGLQVDPDKVDDAAEAVADMDEVTWVSVTTGQFNILVCATLRSSQELSAFLRKRVGVIGGVRRMETFINLASKQERHGINMESVVL